MEQKQLDDIIEAHRFMQPQEFEEYLKSLADKSEDEWETWVQVHKQPDGTAPYKRIVHVRWVNNE